MHTEFIPPGQTTNHMRNSAAKSWGGLGWIWGAGGQTNGAWTNGCSITTMCPHIHCFGCAALFGLKKQDGHPQSLLLAWFSPLWLLPLLYDENQVEWAKIWHCRGDSGLITEGAKRCWHKRTYRTASNHGKNVGIAVYTSKWTPLKGTVAIRTVRVSIFFDTLRELLDSTSCINLNI